jgi:hypothetical protein
MIKDHAEVKVNERAPNHASMTDWPQRKNFRED